MIEVPALTTLLVLAVPVAAVILDLLAMLQSNFANIRQQLTMVWSVYYHNCFSFPPPTFFNLQQKSEYHVRGQAVTVTGMALSKLAAYDKSGMGILTYG